MTSKRRRVSISFDKAEGMTRQEFEPECEINNIMAKYQKTGVINHINTHGPMYGEFNAVDFQTAMETIKEGENMFAELPSTARKYFDNDPAKFMEFVHDPDNVDKLIELGLASKPVENPQTPDPVVTPTDTSENAS